MPDINYDLAEKANALAVRHARKGTDVEKAWPEIVAVARPALGKKLADTALALPITPSLVQVTSIYTARLTRDNPGAKVKGLYLGLVELVVGKSLGNTIITPYLAGVPQFDPNDQDWGCGPIWMPRDCYATNYAMHDLSRMRKGIKDGDEIFMIEVGLVGSLNILFTSQIARHLDPAILLGKSKQRGIGCGYDAGELHTLGVVTKAGFKPLAK